VRVCEACVWRVWHGSRRRAGARARVCITRRVIVSSQPRTQAHAECDAPSVAVTWSQLRKSLPVMRPIAGLPMHHLWYLRRSVCACVCVCVCACVVGVLLLCIVLQHHGV
jgi:hypothetical protein